MPRLFGGAALKIKQMKHFIILLGFLFCANLAASQDSIYIKKDTTTQNVLIYDASDSTLVYCFMPTYDLRAYGTRYVALERNGQEVFAIKPSEVTSTIVNETSSAFSGTATDLLTTLATSFFYIHTN